MGIFSRGAESLRHPLLGIVPVLHVYHLKAPIRFDLLKRIISVVPRVAKSAYDTALLRAVFALAYYGCCRIGELVDSGSLQHTLKLSNVVQNLERDPPVTTFLLSTAKHARSAAKFRLSGFSDPRYCAVSLLSLYLNLRPLGGEFCFVSFSGVPAKKGFHCPRPFGLPPPGWGGPFTLLPPLVPRW